VAAGGDIRDQALLQIFATSAQIRRTAIINTLLQAHGGNVISGPFAGMKLLPEASWGDGDLSPKLLGCYEAELHLSVAKAVSRLPDVIVNVGCAEGYYAVGMARLLPRASVLAFDASEQSQDICRRAAAANNVSDRVRVAGTCDAAQLRQVLTQARRYLLFVDCEGAELDLLDPVRVPEILKCDMIVECHDFVKQGITQTLIDHFTPSHDVENLIEGARDPNQFASLRGWQSIDRWLAVNEGRPVTMNWLACWTR
jgi:hypothetical protein